jgi:acyl-CoA thioesterase I
MKVSTLAFICIVIFISLGAGFFYYIKFVVPEDAKKSVTTAGEVRTRRIVAFGDSLTYGYNLPTTDSYPSQLQKKLDSLGYNYKVINVGINGDTTTDGLARVNEALSFEPDLVLLEFGANDFLRSQPPELAQQNLDKIIKTFDDKNVKVILLNIEQNPLLPLPNRERFQQIMPELGKKYGLPVVTSFLGGILLNSEFTLEDRLHPNKAGYIKAINENLWPVLEKQLVK